MLWFILVVIFLAEWSFPVFSYMPPNLQSLLTTLREPTRLALVRSGFFTVMQSALGDLYGLLAQSVCPGHPGDWLGSPACFSPLRLVFTIPLGIGL